MSRRKEQTREEAIARRDRWRARRAAAVIVVVFAAAATFAPRVAPAARKRRRGRKGVWTGPPHPPSQIYPAIVEQLRQAERPLTSREISGALGLRMDTVARALRLLERRKQVQLASLRVGTNLPWVIAPPAPVGRHA